MKLSKSVINYDWCVLCQDKNKFNEKRVNPTNDCDITSLKDYIKRPHTKTYKWVIVRVQQIGII